MNNEMTESVKKMESIQSLIQERLQSFATQLKEAFSVSPEVAEGIRIFLKALQTWPEWQKEYWLKASEMGWYFNWDTPASSCILATNEGKETLDAFMVMHLEDDWEELTKQIFQLCPDRSEILNEAFSLHSEGRYIASIPLLLSQTDGICAEYLGAFLFSEHVRRAEQIKSTLEHNEDKSLDLFFNILKNKNQYSKGIEKSSLSHKEKGPNRSGILHGSRRHLDYGTKINSLKCFSLLAFTVFYNGPRNLDSVLSYTWEQN